MTQSLPVIIRPLCSLLVADFCKCNVFGIYVQRWHLYSTSQYIHIIKFSDRKYPRHESCVVSTKLQISPKASGIDYCPLSKRLYCLVSSIINCWIRGIFMNIRLQDCRAVNTNLWRSMLFWVDDIFAVFNLIKLWLFLVSHKIQIAILWAYYCLMCYIVESDFLLPNSAPALSRA